MPKRKRVSSARAVRTSMRVGNWASLARASRAARPRLAPLRGRLSLSYMNQRLQGLTRMIETKELQYRVVNANLPHNNLAVLGINPFESTQNTGDPMALNSGQRIGDQISVRGLLIKGFMENALGRSRVYFRVMLVKMAKGDTLSRTTFFKQSADNKMIDQVNTERFTVLGQKIFTINTGNAAPTSVNADGTPASNGLSGIATKTFQMWIPGRKFGRDGVVRYENASTTQLKFFDYRIAVVSYDWYGTPQDINTVGKINEMYTKLYFKDA